MARKRIYPRHTILGMKDQETIHTPLDRERIILSALHVLNTNGLKELSMRKIADELQVKTASLYYHVKDKDELLQLVGDKISEEMKWPDTSLPWKEQILEWGDQFRSILRRYRDAVEVFNSSIARGYHRLLQIEKLFQIFVSAGFPDHQIPWMASILKNYVLGFVAEEVKLRDMAGAENATLENLGDQYNEFFQHLPENEFPAMIRLAAYTTNTHWQNEFEFGLEVLIDGFSMKLPSREQEKRV